MTPLTRISDDSVQCPQCRVTFRVGKQVAAHGKDQLTRSMCEVPGCLRLFQHGVTVQVGACTVYMHVNPADIERGLA